MYGYYGNMGGFWPFGILGSVISILFWIAIVFIVISLIRGSRWRMHDGWDGHDGKNALDILKERYAKGEINKKEFEEMKKDIA
jgi:putative membrane protein